MMMWIGIDRDTLLGWPVFASLWGLPMVGGVLQGAPFEAFSGLVSSDCVFYVFYVIYVLFDV